MSSSADLTFVHISDIHFRAGRVGTKHDSDSELREKLEADFRYLVPDCFAPVSGIILTGDIAWAGQRREYEYAESWIRRIAEHLQCSETNVMVTPGNHDVSWPALTRNNEKIAKLQRSVRSGKKVEICVEKLTNALTGKNGKHLLTPLNAYNRFAEKFSCGISASKPYWERTFNLGNGADLIIRGITSTWLSGPNDSEITRRLLYGSAQYSFSKQPDSHYVVAGHHPPGNMIDGEDAAKSFEFFCKLQLFGHKHELWITQSPKSARIIAGAFHPDRGERPWIPRYNIVEIFGEMTEKAKPVSIKVYPRRWNEEFRVFMPDFGPNKEEVRNLKFVAD